MIIALASRERQRHFRRGGAPPGSGGAKKNMVSSISQISMLCAVYRPKEACQFIIHLHLVKRSARITLDPQKRRRTKRGQKFVNTPKVCAPRFAAKIRCGVRGARRPPSCEGDAGVCQAIICRFRRKTMRDHSRHHRRQEAKYIRLARQQVC